MGSLGTLGSASHNFKQVGVIKIDTKEITEEKVLDIVVESGADECFSNDQFHEIHCEKSKIYDVKKKLEKSIKNFISTEIEWIPLNILILKKNKVDNVSNFIETLDDEDDVQNIFTNFKIEVF